MKIILPIQALQHMTILVILNLLHLHTIILVALIQSPYTESELKSDPSAPSTNVNDYNSDGEYVPENGPTDNPEDYNVNGEYKPIENMTKEEIEAELESMFNDNF